MDDEDVWEREESSGSTKSEYEPLSAEILQEQADQLWAQQVEQRIHNGERGDKVEWLGQLLKSTGPMIYSSDSLVCLLFPLLFFQRVVMARHVRRWSQEQAS